MFTFDILIVSFKTIVGLSDTMLMLWLVKSMLIWAVVALAALENLFCLING
jgi:hypothetical protein